MEANGPTLSDDTFMFARNIKIETVRGGESRGGLAVYLAECQLVVKVLARWDTPDHGSGRNASLPAPSCEFFIRSFDSKDAVASLKLMSDRAYSDVPEKDAVMTLAELLLDSTTGNRMKESDRATFWIDERATLIIRAGPGDAPWKTMIAHSSEPSTSQSIASFALSMISVLEEKEEEAEEMKTEIEDLKADRDDCKLKMRQLSDFSEREKTRLVSSFYELYLDMKDRTPEEDAEPLHQDKRSRSSAATRNPWLQIERSQPAATSVRGRLVNSLSKSQAAAEPQNSRQSKYRRTEVTSQTLENSDSDEEDDRKPAAAAIRGAAATRTSQADSGDDSGMLLPSQKKRRAAPTSASNGSISDSEEESRPVARGSASDSDAGSVAKPRAVPGPPQRAQNNRKGGQVATAHDNDSDSDSSTDDD
jgi:hypothetical protein